MMQGKTPMQDEWLRPSYACGDVKVTTQFILFYQGLANNRVSRIDTTFLLLYEIRATIKPRILRGQT